MLGIGNIKLLELAEKFKLIIIFGLLSISIIILIIMSHVELHNKTVFTVQLTVFMPYLNLQLIFNQIKVIMKNLTYIYRDSEWLSIKHNNHEIP